MNGSNERNFDFADYLVGIQKENRKITGIDGNNIAIYQYMAMTDGATFTDSGCVIAQANTGKYGTDKYNFCVYGA